MYYTDPVMQKVAKLCEDGHWPICKDEDGSFAVFTPILDDDGYIYRGSWDWTIEKAKQSLTHTPVTGRYGLPTEIVGFYHPPTPKFKIGDKVRVREDLADTLVEHTTTDRFFKDKASKIGTIISFKSKNSYIVAFGGSNWEFTPYQLEPVLKTEPVIVEMTVAEIEEKLGVKNLKIVK